MLVVLDLTPKIYTNIMKTMKFPNGDVMPALGLGTWKSKPEEMYNTVKTAISLGYRHIDCAAIYGNEIEIGQALADCIQEGLVKREDLWITSKLWCSSHGLENVEPALQKTLNDLQLDYLDLYLIHWPVAFKSGVVLPDTGDDFISLEELPIAETWRGMENSVEKGLCHHIGVSNFSIKKLRDLLKIAKIKPEMNQIELHPYLQQNKMLEFCKESGIFITAYSSLGSSDRPDNLKTNEEPILLQNPVIINIAKKHNCSNAQILLAWGLQRGTSVIPKSVNPQRLQENLAADEINLSDDEMAEIAKLDINYRYLSGSFWAIPGSPYTIENIWDDD